MNYKAKIITAMAIRNSIEKFIIKMTKVINDHPDATSILSQSYARQYGEVELLDSMTDNIKIVDPNNIIVNPKDHPDAENSGSKPEQHLNIEQLCKFIEDELVPISRKTMATSKYSVKVNYWGENQIEVQINA